VSLAILRIRMVLPFGNYLSRNLKVHNERINHLGNDTLVIIGREEVSICVLFLLLKVDILED
jgi:hypothetical protein